MTARPSTVKRAIFPLIALIPLVAATVWLVTEEPQAPSVGEQQTPEPASQAEAPVHQPPPVAGPVATEDADAVTYRTPESLGENPFARSLAGTDIDGSLKADASGNLIVDLATRDFFDYFLNTVGEVSPETALDKIEALARNHLPEQAAKQALAILDQYLDYKQQALAMGNQALDPSRQNDPDYRLQVLKTALSDLKQIRRNAFDGTTHQAFFGMEEAYGDYTLANIEISQRDDLSAESKQTLMQWQREQLPEQIRKTETRMIEDTEISRQRQAAIAESTSPEEAGKRLRELGTNPQQVEEVVGYLREREQFDQQFQDYRQALASLDNAGISSDEKQSQQDRLLEQHFETEQARTWAKLRSLDTP
jgi:lipase chaperone LimK